MKEKICANCGVLFKIKLCKFLKRRFCSNKCYLEKLPTPWNKGLSKADFPQLSNSGVKRGSIPWNKGKEMPMLHGEKHYNWIPDRTKIKKQEERNNPNDKQWKYSVYKRDNFKCRLANENCSKKIEAHHIKSWKEYQELRYKTNNGITLCHAHHPRKRAEEKRLEPVFMELVSVSK